MGLFDARTKQEAEQATVSPEMGAAAIGANEEEASFLDGDAGQGFEGMDSSAMAVPFLMFTQSISEIVESGEVEPGHFVNSATKEDYGTRILVVVCKFTMAWTEKDQAGKSLARYEIGSIPVTGDSYTGMINPATGNKIVETYYYQLLLPEHPEAGFVIFSSTPGNMRYLKVFHSMLKSTRLPSGNIAPLYAGIWEWVSAPDVSKKTGKKYFSFKGGIHRVGWIPQVLYRDMVLPVKNAPFMLPAPVAEVPTGEIEEEGKY